jgi:hypothetical protein
MKDDFRVGFVGIAAWSRSAKVSWTSPESLS